jgi:predicted DNA-binding transcriptional regulator AlpA
MKPPCTHEGYMTVSQTEATASPRPPAENGDATDNSGLRRMLNEKQVLDIVPVSPVTLWRMERDGRFPRGTFISPNKKIWWADEIAAWQREVDGRRRGRQHHPASPNSTTT